MWYPYRLADCGSSPDLTRLATKSPVWNNDEDDEEEEESDDRLSQISTTFHTTSYVSGPCTGNCYPGATPAYPTAMYPSHGYPSPSHPQPAPMYPGMVGLQKSMTCSFVPSFGYGYPYPQCQQPSMLIEEVGKNSQEQGGQGFLKMDPQDYSPDTDQKEASPQPSKTVDDTTAAVKKKYSDASLKPDSSLPPVIRRRNRNRRKMLAQSMVDGGCWDAQGRYRSQSVSDEQWSQLLAAQGHAPPPPPPPADPSTNQRSRFNTVAGGVANNRTGPGRGMMSSASVCDLNTLSQQQPQHLHQQQHMQQQQQHQLMPHMGGMHQSGSFQQLNMVPYTGGMMWAPPPPPPCDMCHAQPPMYPPPLPSHGMKRAASNISMNMSSASSDVTGYPWQQHMHHHMAPQMYPGYYPQPPPHMMPNSMQGSSISIPDSMAAFSKVSSSPAPSVRSSSRRSHKSSKSRSFSTADLSRRTRSSHRSESDDSTTSSPSVEEELHNSSVKPGYPGGPLAWQCDHCTFINQPGSRICGMCSKNQGAGTHQRTNRRVSERRRGEQRRYVQRRNNDNEDDDREPSDYENDGKHNNIQYNNNRDNRRDKSSKSSTTSRSKKKLRKRGGSSGSASDVVEELERQLSDIKLSKSRGPEYEGISSRLKERDRDKDRERGSRRREGLSGRYKSRSKNASERSRTPGRPSPEGNQSAQGSPRDDSPQDDEVFAAFENEEKKPENNNSNSNEGTLVGPGNSDETILVTEYRKSKSDSRIRRGKSAISSRASTPGPVAEIQHAEEEILPPVEIMEVVKPIDPKPQPDYLDIPKPREKSPSPFRQNSHPETAEEPSFANTLDDIATMGTNEVADMDPYMDERPLSALPVNIDDIQHFIPTARYVEEKSQNEMKETAVISEHEDFLVEKAHSSSIKIEVAESNKEIDAPQEVQVDSEPQVNPSDINEEENYEPEVEQQADISEQPFENASENLENAANEVPEQGDGGPSKGEFVEADINEVANDRGETSEYETNDEAPQIIEVVREHQNEEPHETSPNRGSLEDINIRPSTSFASLTGLGSMPRDRQFTPLSFSSSDAAFYSPADSPDESLEEKLKDKPSGSQTQPKPKPAAVGADRSPSSFKGISEGVPPRPGSPEGGYLSSDAYEGLSFQDALSGHSDFYGMQKSASDQGERRWLQGDEASLSVEEIIARRKQETMKRDGLQLVHVLREAEKAGYRAEEVSVALPLCGDRGPLQWLTDNWWTMVDTVRTLASNYGREKQQNNVGEISEQEARAALRTHRGNIWAAVTESVEQRQTKFAAVCAMGDFDHEAVSQALQKTDGDVEAAYRELTSGETSDSDFYHSFQPDESSFVNNPLLSQHGEDEAYLQLYANFSKASSVSQAVHQATMSGRSTRPVPPPPTQQAAKPSRSRRPAPPPPPHQPDDDTSVYSNIVSSSNPLLVAKTEALLQELEDEAPMLSRDLKFKIVKAILDEEPNSTTERQQIDSDEESTIEELLAREQNPTFYEYFTAVDLDEEGEDYQELQVDDSAASETASDSFMAQGDDTTNYDGDDPAGEAGSPNYENHEPENRGNDRRNDRNDNDGVGGDSAIYGNVDMAGPAKQPSAMPPATKPMATPSTAAGNKRKEETVYSSAVLDRPMPGPTAAAAGAEMSAAAAQAAEMLYVRREDVVVHPLKAYTHYADLSTSNYSDADDFLGSSRAAEVPDQTRRVRATSAPVKPNDRLEALQAAATNVQSSPKHTTHNNVKTEVSVNNHSKQRLQPGTAASATTTNIAKTSAPTTHTGVVMRQKKPLPLENETETTATEVQRSSVTYEDGSTDEEEESVSVTTGRLSLTLSHTSDKDGAIDVTAATVQKEVVQTELAPRVKTPVGAGGGGAKAAPSARATATSAKTQNSVKRKTDIRHIATLEQQEQQKLQAVDTDATAPSSRADEAVIESSIDENILQLDTGDATEEAALPSRPASGEGGKDGETPATGTSSATPKQPPVKKASNIIGKAIAKAMARESTVKEGSVGREDSPAGSGGLYSPEPEDYSSRGSTPASFTQDSTVASSSMIDSADSTPVSTTPASNTPRSTPDLTEDVSGTMQEAVDSEDEELLRSLDTIPEEGPVKNLTQVKELKSALKPSASTSALETNKSEESESPSSPMTGAQMLAEESANTVKRSPKNSSVTKSSTTPDVGSVPVSNMEPKTAQQATKTTPTKTKSTKGKGKGKTSKPESDYYSSSEQTDGSKSNEDNTVVQTTSSAVQNGTAKTAKKKLEVSAASSQASSSSKGNEVNTKSTELKPNTDSKQDISDTKIYASAKPKHTSSESKPNVSEPKAQTPSTLTVKPKTPTPASAQRKTELRSPGSGPSAFSPPPTSPKTPVKNRSAMDSSGESEDEDKLANAQRLESLKGREPDYQEVQDLKQQITDLKKSLQSQMSDDDRDHDTKSPLPRIRVQSGAGTPTISVEPPSVGAEEGEEGLLKPRTEEESTQYEQLRFDRTVRRLLAEGQAGSYEKAELAAHLLSLSFDEEDSIAAAQECSSIYGALHFLQQDCELCAEKFPMKNMVSMLYCTHRCCIDCARTYFTYQIKTKNIRELRCPFCNEPNIDTSEDSMDEYFNHLDILLKGIVDEETHELFQRKLRDLTLMSDPNFRWCNKCSSGFIANPRARKLICPDCKDVTCAHCRLPWEATHEGISCDAFAKWQQENDPEAQAQGVAKHLAENGITCPKCRFQYSLAKGGCMHFTCTECKYEFCSGCGQPFRQGAKCPVGPYCERLGLHAHHPRNCLFYLRDKDPPQLQQLLKENNVPFDIEPREEQSDAEKRKHCQVAEQKEMPEGLVDDICGRAVLQGNAGLCRQHYVEYLVRLINVNKLDPISMLDEEDLWFVLRRENMDRPRKIEGETKPLYRRRMLELIKEQLPL